MRSVRRERPGRRVLLRLLESRRARLVAGWAATASLAVHASGVAGVVLRGAPHGGDDGPAAGPISIRYLLPPDRVRQPVGERLVWVALGAPTRGFAAAAGPPPAPTPPAGETPPPGAVRPTPEPEVAPPDDTRLYTVDEVDSAATRDPASDGPRYPEPLREAGVQGQVVVQFTVDTTGRADTATYAVIEATHPLFADAVREALPRMRFTPALAAGHRVRQVVRLPMRFRLQTEVRPSG